ISCSKLVDPIEDVKLFAIDLHKQEAVMSKTGGSDRVGRAGSARMWRRVAVGRARGIAGAVLLAGPIGPALATEASSPQDDKSFYTLANPTPDRLLRDLTTDRPDMTESPFTVDAGRVQTETNLFGY